MSDDASEEKVDVLYRCPHTAGEPRPLVAAAEDEIIHDRCPLTGQPLEPVEVTVGRNGNDVWGACPAPCKTAWRVQPGNEFELAPSRDMRAVYPWENETEAPPEPGDAP